MTQEMVEAYANMKLEAYKAAQEVKKLASELEGMKESSVSIDFLRANMYINSDSTSAWVKSGSEQKFIALIKGAKVEEHD